MSLSPIGGRCRVYLFDEAHALTKDAQTALLKMLEDPFPHVYFMLCTTDPVKLIPTIRTRCTAVTLSLMSEEAIGRALRRAAKLASFKLTKEVGEKIIACSDGSGRKAIVLLDSIQNIEDEEEQLQAIEKGDIKKDAFAIAQGMFRGMKWPEMAAILKTMEQDPEGYRHMILSYAATVLLGGGKTATLAAAIIDIFARPFFDSKKPGLIAACYEVTLLGQKK